MRSIYHIIPQTLAFHTLGKHALNHWPLKLLHDPNIMEFTSDPKLGYLIKRNTENLPLEPIKAARIQNKHVKSRYDYISTPEKHKGKFLHNDKQLNSKSVIRIKAGSAKGKKIHLPRVPLRPMMSRVKDAVFSIIQHMGFFALGRETNVLDLFCGTGSLGIEALSRGAKYSTFVDLDNACCEATSHNLRELRLNEKSRVIRADAMEILNSPWLMSLDDIFDIAFICPPYERIVYGDLIESVATTRLFKQGSIIVLEYPKELGFLPQSIHNGELIGLRNRKFGRTTIAIYVKNPDNETKLLASKRTKEFRLGKEKIHSLGVVSSPSNP
ncbi:Conserved hypothetical protein 95 [Babesia microti strain RI]|uniref:Uncharacterized protein n=1 Tax=Babesia microti (strain RI) TaxID=1133968 RepID=A0A1N6LXY8_BABMR|nr:Conserved hypothetical protein 95 [Babesia microti strain RI]SIO73750.1 Conserved hypothetical protein 95 [Babesia microti strain RI]|eukprot:XP_021337813.1 Conserved hypothetical protein 95 [Babesia microti strain RI]